MLAKLGIAYPTEYHSNYWTDLHQIQFNAIRADQ